MFKNTIRSFSIATALVATLAIGLGTSTAAFADTPAASLDITAGSLSEVAPLITVNSTNTVAQNGTDQNLPVTMPITVTDATGSAAGWKVTIRASAFTDGTNTLHNAPTVSDVTAVAVSGSTSTDPTNTADYTNFIIPTSTATTLFNAASGTGMGQFTLTPTMNLKIQSNDATANYSSTFTLAAVSGPN